MSGGFLLCLLFNRTAPGSARSHRARVSLLVYMRQVPGALRRPRLASRDRPHLHRCRWSCPNRRSHCCHHCSWYQQGQNPESRRHRCNHCCRRCCHQASQIRRRIRSYSLPVLGVERESRTAASVQLDWALARSWELPASAGEPCAVQVLRAGRAG